MRTPAFLRLAALLLFPSLVPAAETAFDIYMQVTPPSGPAEVTDGASDPLYAGWSKLRTFSTRTNSPQNQAPPGPVTSLPATLEKYVDSGSPPLFSKVMAGSPFAKVKLVVVARSAAKVELWDVEYCSGYFSGMTVTCSDGELIENVNLAARTVTWSYMRLSPSGEARQEHFSKFTLGDETAETGTRVPDYLAIADTDHDGIPDGWEAEHGLNKDVADADADPDQDGVDNLHEYFARTDPRSPQSVFRLNGMTRTASGQFLMEWDSVEGVTYRVESGETPAGPFNLIKQVAATGAKTSTTFPVPAASRSFFRVVPVPPQ